MKKLVLVAGLAMRAVEFAHLATLFSPRSVLYFDNPCVGEGPRPTGSLTISDQAEHQWAEIELAVGSEPVHLFGLSMGGMIASTMAATRPERTASLTVAATSPNLLPEIEAIPSELEKAWVQARTKKDLALAVDIAFGKTTKQTSPKIRDEYFYYRASGQNKQSTSEFAKQLNAIRSFDGLTVYKLCRQANMPSLVLAGEEDELFPANHSVAIGELLGVEVRYLEKTGHMLHLESAALLAQHVQHFLSRIES